ncbi:MAG: tRNA 2-thiouridine(34) synthase MnmA [Candidatus Falkowbacteria bacterium]|nr:MAG: tRNA 2-thiouridine(34) synthase MnmA [Candidatus Falkowbacteria bacterium]
MKNNNKSQSQNKSKFKKKVLIGMSGGVDSSVAAQLLKNQGYEVAGIFLHFWKDESAGSKAENRCCSLESLMDARKVAAKVGIPLYTFDFSAPFKKAVVDKFLDEYAAGRTPNPCVVCNKQIKIGRLLKYARRLGYDYVATGHYLNIKKVGKSYQLFKAKDKLKDQTYFLYTFSQDELAHLLFPLGGYKKPQVRKLAAKHGLMVESKAESQDICFLSGPHNDFLKKYLKLTPGPIKLLETGKEIGTHQGLPLYTIGQRRGIEIGGTGPYYAAKLDYRHNILYVVKEWNQEVLYKKELVAKKVNWLSGVAPKKTLKCQAVIRYGHKAVACEVSLKNEREYLVKFARPQRAITGGQSVVFYDKERVLGGGIIK